MLYREKASEIEDWLDADSKALLVTGARQVGKTYLIRHVLRKRGVRFFEFNLIEQPEVVELFDAAQHSSAGTFLARLSLLCGESFQRGNTVLFFDEIQERRDIVTKTKFLVEEGSCRYVLSGSLLGVELTNLKSAPVGYLRTVRLHPLSLKEFFIALGMGDDVINLLRESFDDRLPVDPFIHDRLMEAVRTYLVVGGMPEAVSEYVSSGDFNRVMTIHRAIMEQYRLDFTKYESADRKLRIIDAYDLVPSEINAKNKRYIFTHLDENLKFDRYEPSFKWLAHAGVALPCYNVTEPKIPLVASRKSNLFKLFLSDVGLLSTQYGRATALKTLNAAPGVNYGASYENLVAQELSAHGYSLYYFNSKKQGEIDFVIEHEGRIIPIEVKSGKDYAVHSALDNVLKNPEYGIGRALVLCNGNVALRGGIAYLPVYLSMFIREDNWEFPPTRRIDLGGLGAKRSPHYG